MTQPQISFIGAGNMSASLIGGLLRQGLPAAAIRGSNPDEERRLDIARTFGIQTFASNIEAIQGADVVVLAVKPQVMKSVCQELAPHLEERQLIISIAAGITCATLERWLGGRAIVRCMPNTPALLGRGVSGLYANAMTSAEQRQTAEHIVSCVGLAFWVDREGLIDAVTAVSGSGPAYFFLLMDCMTRAGEQLGLPRETAEQLSVHTALGAAQMAIDSDVDTQELIRRVASPRGTTEAALNTFHQGGFEALVRHAMQAAADRSVELSEQLDQ